MILCDVGNTSYHFLSDDQEFKENVDSFNPETMKEKIFYINVNQTTKKKLHSLKNWIDLSEYVDMKNYYKTMGIDRIFACEAVENAIIIDAGSAITVDVVKNTVFQGGLIYPGIEAILNTYKNISPALEYAFNYKVDLHSLPKNSQDALSYGFLKPIYCEVISHNLDVILTGGNAEELHNVFKGATLDKELIFKGMKKTILKRIQ